MPALSAFSSTILLFKRKRQNNSFTLYRLGADKRDHEIIYSHRIIPHTFIVVTSNEITSFYKIKIKTSEVSEKNIKSFKE